MRVRQFRLNEIAVEDDKDYVFSEFTSVLAAPGREKEVWMALLGALTKSDYAWDELIVNYALASAEPMLSSLGLRVHRRVDKGSGFVDLGALRRAGVSDVAGYVATLGKATRAALSRSMRLYAERGPLTLARAADAAEAQDWFAEIVRLQTAKWRDRGGRGLADRRMSRDFHERLIANAFPLGAVELLRVSAGAEAFAWLCNFVDRGRVLCIVAGL
ncbi:MAG: GNAT family N-acetyltransferase, partial [Parvularculaceae bacterium]|nr:GNAT family N-acetyltransferase [Parvularculaceae bacterium]